jgi:exosortase/archaeosortase family protein
MTTAQRNAADVIEHLAADLDCSSRWLRQCALFAERVPEELIPAISDAGMGFDHVIALMNQGRIGVIDACNGLGMMYMFLAVSTAVALLIRNPLIDKLIIIASAVPIAFVSNLVRITVTGVLQETVGGETAHVVYHDLAGWLMMPLALGILWIELRLLANLFLESGPRHPMPLEFGRAAIPRNEHAKISVPPR